jgi:hypothetical protein
VDYVFWGVLGVALTTAFLMHFWLPDPPPPLRYFVIVVASFIGGALGGGLGSTVIAGSNPMPGRAVLGALALGLVAGGASVVLGGRRVAGVGR